MKKAESRQKNAPETRQKAKMDTASALATIKACMAAPSNPVACVILRANGKSEEIVADQRKLGSFLGANPTIVGAIISLDVTVVVRSDNTGNKNTHSFPEGWEPNLKGDIILFRTDNDGGSLPFTLKEHRAWVAEGMPNRYGLCFLCVYVYMHMYTYKSHTRPHQPHHTHTVCTRALTHKYTQTHTDKLTQKYLHTYVC